MKRTFSFGSDGRAPLIAAGTALVAATYGLVRLACGLFLPDVQAELTVGDGAAGLIASAASLVYCVGALAGFLVAVQHPRRLVVLAALTAGGGAAGMAAAPDAGIFAAAAIVSSAGAGLASPALVAIVRRNVRAQRNERAQAIVNAGTGPGLVGAGVLALALLPDWRVAWYLVAAATLVVAALVLRLDRPRDAAVHDVPIGLVPPAPWFRAHRVIIAAAVLMGGGSAAVWTYGRSLLVQGGASATVSVSAWIALGLGGTAVIGTVRVMDRLHPRVAWSVTATAAAVASAVIGGAPHLTVLALAACVAFGWGYTAGTGALIAWTMRLDPRRASTGTSMLFVMLILGQALGAAAAGALADRWSVTAAFLAAAVVSAVAAAVPQAIQPRAVHADDPWATTEPAGSTVAQGPRD